MVSDTLFDAGEEIRRYLADMPDIYKGDIRAAIVRLLVQMDEVRVLLDAAPEPPGA
jgi:hypothetical protein